MLDSVLGTPETKQLLETTLKDTVGDENADFERLNKANSANDVAESVTMKEAFGVADMLFSSGNEEEDKNSVWGVFKNGLANSGLFRKDKRSDDKKKNNN